MINEMQKMMMPWPLDPDFGLARISPTFRAMCIVYKNFEGRDRLRIKREINKALKAIPKPDAGGIDRCTHHFWRNHDFRGAA